MRLILFCRVFYRICRPSLFPIKSIPYSAQTLKKIALILLGLMLVYGYCSDTFMIVVNKTDSLPYRLFVLRRGPYLRSSSTAEPLTMDPPKKDAYVLFMHSVPGEIPETVSEGESLSADSLSADSLSLKEKTRTLMIIPKTIQMTIPMIKQVKGVPGSRLYQDAQNKLWVDDFCVGTIRKTTSTGKPLSPITASVVPEGYVFVYASHDRSFDSRYQEMGLVPIVAIQGSGIAIL